MEEQFTIESKGSFRRNYFNYGLIAAVLMILYSLLIYVFELYSSRGLSMLSYIILIVLMFLGTKAYRDKINHGMLTYARGFSQAFYIGLVASAILAIYVFVFYQFFDPGAIDKIAQLSEDAMLEQRPDMSDEEIELAMKMARKFMSPVWMAVWGFISNLIGVLIIALVVPLILKREEPPQTNAV